MARLDALCRRWEGERAARAAPVDQALKEPLRWIRRMHRRRHSGFRANLRRPLEGRRSRMPPGLEGFVHEGMRMAWWLEPFRSQFGAVGSAPSRGRGRPVVLSGGATRGLEEQARAHGAFTVDDFVAFAQGPLDALGSGLPDSAAPESPSGGTRPRMEPRFPGVDGGEEPDEGGVVLPDPTTSRTGVCHWEFSVMADGAAGAGALAQARTAHGTAAELLHDVGVLEVGWLRQLGHADAHLETMWKGCAVYTALDAVDNRWLAADLEPELGWRCIPATPPPTVDLETWLAPADSLECDAALPLDDCPPPHEGGPPCSVPDHGPRVMTGALFDLAEALAGVGSGAFALPVLLGRSNRGETGTDPCDPAYFRYYDWPYVDADGELRSQDEAARFVLYPVDSVVAGEGANEDRLLDEFLRQLLGGAAAGWGGGTSLPYVQLGNELLGETCADGVGWLVLRLCELVGRCAPSVVRVFPALASPSDRPAGPGDPVLADPYLDRTEDNLDQVFYHLVRAALVVREEGGGSDDHARFAELFWTGVSGIEDAWTNAGDSLVALLNARYYDGIGASLDAESDVPSDALPAESPAEDDPRYAIVEAVRDWSASNLSAPFQVMDFHWYNARGDTGDFLYLSAVAAFVARLRDVLGRWWYGGGAMPVWCTETGVSSARTPEHLRETAAEVTDGADTVVCYGQTGRCGVAPEVPGEREDFEYRIDPSVVEEAALAGRPMFPMTPADWPSWVFTSEREQAVQVWARLSFLAGVGVEKVWWYSNVVSEDRAGRWTRFYGYGLTEDLRESSMTAGCGDCGMVDPFEPEGAPALPYSERYKKPAFCALKRWSHYLGRYHCAAVVPRFDGLDEARGYENQGFYAVVFRIDEDSAERPFALVTWTDAQVFSRCADEAFAAGLDAPLSGCVPDRRLVFVSAAGAAAPPPRVVPTVPQEFVGTEAVVVNPCLDDGEAEAAPAAGEPGYAAGRVWRFGPDRDVPYRELLPGAYGVRVGVHALHLPVLVLLPAGRLVTEDPSGGMVEEVFVLDAAALVAGAC